MESVLFEQSLFDDGNIRMSLNDEVEEAQSSFVMIRTPEEWTYMNSANRRSFLIREVARKKDLGRRMTVDLKGTMANICKLELMND